MKKPHQCIILLAILPWLLLLSFRSHAQCNWGISVTSTNSNCAASSKISVVLTGADKANVSRILYRLQAIDGSGYNIKPTASPLFENIPPGTYRVYAQGVCQQTTVSVSQVINVTGTYQILSGNLEVMKRSLYSCSTGQIKVNINGGRPPFHIRITGAPDAYVKMKDIFCNSDYVLDSIPAGDYTFILSDSCGTQLAPKETYVDESPQLTADAFFWDQRIYPINQSCNQVVVEPLYLYTGPQWVDYQDSLMVAFSYNHGPRSAYRNEKLGQKDTVAAQMVSMYGNTVTYYVRPSCGPEFTIDYTIPTPILQFNMAKYCTGVFDFNYGLSATNVCFPVYISLNNTSTNVTTYDTLRSASGIHGSLKQLSYGNYNYTAVTSDGYDLGHGPLNVTAPTASGGYSLLIFPEAGQTGMDGVTGFRFYRAGAVFTPGTLIELISPDKYKFSYTSPGGSQNELFFNPADNGGNFLLFRPDNYTFRITDPCGPVYNFNLTVTDDDVYHYYLDSVVVKQSCNNKTVTPYGYYKINKQTYPSFFGLYYPSPYNLPIHNYFTPSGTPWTFSTGGYIHIGMTIFGSNMSINTIEYGGNGVGVTDATFYDEPLQLDATKSFGWICPNTSPNSGKIVSTAMGGLTGTSGHYTYRLAHAGDSSGNYMDTNFTGTFVSTANYTLGPDSTYDVHVSDDCGNIVVQPIKVVNLATAQLATLDQNEYCLGTDAQLNVINLPPSIRYFAWTGPDGFTSNDRNPVVSPVTVNSGGVYYVTMDTHGELCSDPIHGQVTLNLAPYVISCKSEVTDTSVNPYKHGLLGNWRAQTTYIYYGPRSESDPTSNTDIRNDGTYNDFTDFFTFWDDQATQILDTTRWVWNTKTTLFNQKGYELESCDAMGRYSAGIYGYNNNFPVASVQNSRYREAAFDGFEDYDFGENCDSVCVSGRRFDFTPYKSNIDPSQHHTGKFSMRVAPTDTVGIISLVTDTVPPIHTLAFTQQQVACSYWNFPVLNQVKADSTVLLPPFSPLSGKKILVSAWVKEAQDCKCQSYTNSRIRIYVKKSNANADPIIALPSGSIIDGWQRFEQVVDLPAGTDSLYMVMEATGGITSYFDDIRIHPYNANMKSFVYDPQTLRLMAELDENNYATFYEYDDDGTLSRLKKETERGVKTVTETRSALIKE